MVTPIIDESIISSDAGNGWAAVYRLLKGKIKTAGIPHARARVTGARLETDMGAQNVIAYADFQGERWGYGDGIWNLTDSPVDTHQNTARRYGGNMHIFLLLVCMAELGVKSSSDLTLIVPAPPGLLNDVSSEIKRVLLAGENDSHAWQITLRTDKAPRTYAFKRVITLPEGAGAFAAFRFNQDGEVVTLKHKGGDMLDGRVTVLDLGAGTGDSYTVYNGNLNADALIHSTDAKAGVLHNLLKPILGEILTAVPAARPYLTTAHVDSYLRRYLAARTEESATIRLSGINILIDDVIKKYMASYAEWIANNKIDPLFSSGADSIIAAGGGWIYIMDAIKRNYSGRLILTPDQFAHTKQIALYDLNGVGQLHFAAAVMRNHP